MTAAKQIELVAVADYLAGKGVPFRDAHHVAGRLVRHAQAAGKTLAQLSLTELRAESAVFDQDVFEALDPQTAVDRRTLLGGPARRAVQTQIAALEARLTARGVAVRELARSFGCPEA